MLIGWDVSTSAIGICVKADDGTTEFGVIYPAGETHAIKHRNAAAQVDAFCKRICSGSVTHVVEQALGGFSGGMTSKQTLMALAAMNAVISFVLSSHGTVLHILPVTTKKITGLKKLEGEDKKDAVVRWSRENEPSFPYRETPAGNYAKGVDDMADAALLAHAGGKIARGEAVIGQPKQVKSNKRKVRASKADGTS